jgi:hypothetical protein
MNEVRKNAVGKNEVGTTGSVADIARSPTSARGPSGTSGTSGGWCNREHIESTSGHVGST